jgi:hypothetical protein
MNSAKADTLSDLRRVSTDFHHPKSSSKTWRIDFSVSTTRNSERSRSGIPVFADSASRLDIMADPFSIPASVLTVVGAAGEVGKGLRLLKVLKGAPEGLDDLLDDISRLELVLETVNNATSDCQAATPAMETLLAAGRKRLAELDVLIQYTLTEAGEDRKVDRLQWTKRRGDVERIRGKLDRIRNDLTLLISTHNSCDSLLS